MSSLVARKLNCLKSEWYLEENTTKLLIGKFMFNVTFCVIISALGGHFHHMWSAFKIFSATKRCWVLSSATACWKAKIVSPYTLAVHGRILLSLLGTVGGHPDWYSCVITICCCQPWDHLVDNWISKTHTLFVITIYCYLPLDPW